MRAMNERNYCSRQICVSTYGKKAVQTKEKELRNKIKKCSKKQYRRSFTREEMIQLKGRMEFSCIWGSNNIFRDIRVFFYTASILGNEYFIIKSVDYDS